ncbi:MAG: DUF1810 domain-containing protein [Halieaceae bacterium]
MGAILSLMSIQDHSSVFDLDRFLWAQEPIYATALAELRQGNKQSHWMWFIFPQLAGLGHSSTARLYAIACMEEAAEYLAHPVLGQRLIECAEAVLSVDGKSIHDILHSPDDLKFKSSMTLFSRAGGASRVFEQALEKYCAGESDELTLALLREIGGDQGTIVTADISA